MEKTSVVFADDHEVVFKSLSRMLDKNIYDIIGHAKNGLELLELVEKKVPDIAVVDLEMPLMNGYDTIVQLNKRFPGIKSIAYSGFMTPETQKKAIKIGVMATVSKGQSTSDFKDAIEAVRQGETFHSDLSSVFWTESFKIRSESILTNREKQVLALVAGGYTSREIGKALYISELTANKHRANIKKKLNLETFSDVLKYAIQHGIVKG